MLEGNSSIPLTWFCEALNLARSSYYAALKARLRRDQLDHRIWKKILKVWELFPGLGYRKLGSKLTINGKKILRILRKFRQPETPRTIVAQKDRRIPNVIKLITQDLREHPTKLARGNWILREGKNKYRYIIEPTRPYQLWAGDWKEFKLRLLGVTLYIFVIIDCYTRQLMGWELSIVKDSQSAIRAGEKALIKANRDPLFQPRNLIMHTDQGGAYLAEDTIQFWRSHGVILSTADRGKPTQNPYIESFFSILVRFWLNYHELLTLFEAQESITTFFCQYNEQWPHSSLNNKSPSQKLEEYRISFHLKNCPKMVA